jgi:hypothetical protein
MEVTYEVSRKPCTPINASDRKRRLASLPVREEARSVSGNVVHLTISSQFAISIKITGPSVLGLTRECIASYWQRMISKCPLVAKS